MSLETGKKAEDRVAEFLSKDGYKIVKRNFYSKFGEIDIIAEKEGILNFFEVKYSKKYDPIYRITPAKMKKIIKTIDYYLMMNKSDEEYQINAALVMDTSIEIIENISF